MKILLRAFPLDVAVYRRPVGGDFFGVNRVVWHHLANGGAQRHRVDGLLVTGDFDLGAIGRLELGVLGFPKLPPFLHLAIVSGSRLP